MTRNLKQTKDNVCIFCGSTHLKKSKFRRTLSWNGRLYTYIKCKTCNGYFLTPELTTSDIEFLYSESYDFDEISSSSSYNIYYENHGYRHAEKLLKFHLQKGMKLLDFGCGSDLTISKLCEAYKVSYTGIEANSSVVKKLQTVSPNNKYLTYQEFQDLADSFDFIFMGDVLEHVSHPFGLLVQLKKCLSSNGRIIIQGPLENSPSLVHLFVKVKSKLLNAKVVEMNPYHVSLATLKSIKSLAQNSELKTVELIVYEVMWPAKKLEAGSFLHLNQVVLRFLKFFDQVISRFLPLAGNRFIMILKSANFNS